ncbi:hypothetical protein SDC9_120021 [bioreactor metagenome]|uniref:Uncharacterized protein n=1 Tax=bioreactor metagenome TaxID=1076179 RepID=A0A645C658_9ZZZZ
MEDDVVLAHEHVAASAGVVPPVAPGVGIAGALGPFDRCRQVAGDRVEPDVDALHVVVAPAVDRDLDAPVEVAGDGARLELLDVVVAEVQHVGTPVLAGVEPFLQLVGQRGQIQEEVLGLTELRSLSVDAAVRVDQVDRIELVAAVVALVAPGELELADRAGALDVAVG